MRDGCVWHFVMVQQPVAGLFLSIFLWNRRKWRIKSFNKILVSCVEWSNQKPKPKAISVEWFSFLLFIALRLASAYTYTHSRQRINRINRTTFTFSQYRRKYLYNKMKLIALFEGFMQLLQKTKKQKRYIFLHCWDIAFTDFRVHQQTENSILFECRQWISIKNKNIKY